MAMGAYYEALESGAIFKYHGWSTLPWNDVPYQNLQEKGSNV